MLVTRVLVSPSYQAESCKKKISPKEEISLSTMELSGTVVKQGYLAKQVWYSPPWSWEEVDSPEPRGRQEPPQRVGRAETPEGTSCQQHLLSQGPVVATREPRQGAGTCPCP